MYSMTFKAEHAKLYSHNIPISLKSAKIVCSKIRKKKLKYAVSFLEDLIKEKQNINGKYYTKTASELLKLVKNLWKNAESKGLDAGELILYVSPKKGDTIHRRRRKSDFGTRMKAVHVEMFAVKGD